jgi:ATP citrate (pro-S)-lyase
VDGITGTLRHFIIEPFLPHAQDAEYYVCIQTEREFDRILFTHEGGVDVGDVDAKALTMDIPVPAASSRDAPAFPDKEHVCATLFSHVSHAQHREALYDYVSKLYKAFVDLHFTYLEINPLVVTQEENGEWKVHMLDLAAKLDQTAEFEAGPKWSASRRSLQSSGVGALAAADDGAPMPFPAPFGRDLTKEEAYIAELDAKTGASLKLTILNRDARIWTMVAGGGASVIYADAIAAAGHAHELANYGEYSGAPNETQTYEYAKTILDLMTRTRDYRGDGGKILFIGGGIANFTNVATTFKGIVRALSEFRYSLQEHEVRIMVRRGGPNWQEGVRMMREVGEEIGITMRVFGPETHITAVVRMALEDHWAQQLSNRPSHDTLQAVADMEAPSPPSTPKPVQVAANAQAPTSDGSGQPFTNTTRAIIYGMQPKAVQGMLDFDYICQRAAPSVACMVYPFGGGDHMHKCYWGTNETLVPVYKTLASAVERHPDADVVVNFASCRSVFPSTMELLDMIENGKATIRTIAIIAEGVPERRARQILARAKAIGNILIIGPATVGGIKPGCFKIGNTGGMMDNIVASKLYRPGSVSYVSKSGGMSNELNNIISRTTDGVCEGVAIGGDRYPGSTFIDHLERFEHDPTCKMMVVLGEVGGMEEYKIIESVRQGRLTKPIVAWCIGTCAKLFKTEVQFGHAGALANSVRETADAKNAALRSVVHVPDTFEDLPDMLIKVYKHLVDAGTIVPFPEPPVPKIPIDYAWAQELGLVRKPAAFVSTICDDRGEELLYAGMRISDVFKEDIGIGGVVSLLWFKRRMPDYATKFIEMVLMLTADHGPAVSGAHNTIVTARAGKDLVSSLVSGLLTIGDRFGGALDGAADMFSHAFDTSQTPREFVDTMRRQNRLILGIGHKIKSRTNPDMRVQLLVDFAKQHFPRTPILDYALRVEQITTAKKDNLILNVDGAIGCLFVDLLRESGLFTREEADEYVQIGSLNGLFVLGRSIGFVGHYLDQRRLKQGLYRHPWDDISYLVPQVQETRAFVGASAMQAEQRK